MVFLRNFEFLTTYIAYFYWNSSKSDEKLTLAYFFIAPPNVLELLFGWHHYSRKYGYVPTHLEKRIPYIFALRQRTWLTRRRHAVSQLCPTCTINVSFLLYHMCLSLLQFELCCQEIVWIGDLLEWNILVLVSNLVLPL